MHRDAIEELYSYTDHAWDLILAELGPKGNDILVDSAPGSGWPTMRDCLGHVLMAYDDWAADLTKQPMILADLAELASWADVERYREQVRERFREMLECDDDDLYRQCDIDVDGETVSYSHGEILANLLLHERGHHGDISTLFYQLGIDMPNIDYRFFVLDTRGSMN